MGGPEERHALLCGMHAFCNSYDLAKSQAAFAASPLCGHEMLCLVSRNTADTDGTDQQMNPRHILAAALVGTISTFSALAFTAPALAEAPAQISAEKVNAPAGTYELDPTHAALLWSFRHNGISNYTGRFEKVSATLKLDPADFRILHHLHGRSALGSGGLPGRLQGHAQG